MDSRNHEQSKERILKIYKYLQALDQLKNPVTRDIKEQPWRLWLKDLPKFETILINNVDDFHKKETFRTSYILKIKRPNLTSAPTPPSKYLTLLKDTWQKPEQKVHIDLTEISEKEEKQEFTESQLLEEFRKDAEFSRWYDKRNGWAQKELPARKAMGVYNQFFELYAKLEKESEQYEIILGDGLLHWEHEIGLIHHPILLRRLKLEFDPLVPEFILSETEHPVELYSALFRSVPEANGTVMSRFQKELEISSFHPLGGKETEEYFKRIITQLSPYGQMLKSHKESANAQTPYLVREPLIFLRRRSFGFSKSIEEIIKDIPIRPDVPSFLENIVGIDTEVKSLEDTEAIRHIDPNGEDEEILLSKPANAEQLLIADRLKRYDAVLVQGPPGTGKTHSIANLIGHLLAQGKSVLVTSHTSKALSVLHEKIVEPLQPLCLSVLSEDSRDQLERSIDAITERLASSDPDMLEREAEKLQAQRLDILKKLRETRGKLLEARADEYRPIVVAGEEYTPCEAARKIHKDMEKCKWLPGPVTLGVPVPLTLRELKELYRTNRSLTREDESELSYPLPDPQELKNPHEIEQLVENYSALAKTDLRLGKEYWGPRDTDTEDADILADSEELIGEIKSVIQFLENASNWQLALMQIGAYGEEELQPWKNLLIEIEKVCDHSTKAKETILRYNPQVKEEGLPKDVETVLEEIITYLKSGGVINFLKLMTKKDWKTVINQSLVNGKLPEQVEHFEALKTFVALRNSRQNLFERWELQVTTLGGPSLAELGQEPEFACRGFRPFITQSLGWIHEVWQPLLKKLEVFGFNWQAYHEKFPVKLGKFAEMERLKSAVNEELIKMIRVQVKRMELTSLKKEISSVKSQIEGIGTSRAKVTVDLLQAIHDLDVLRYREAYRQLLVLDHLSKDLALRKSLLARLEKDAPAWASLIQKREGIHGEGKCPDNVTEAWLWRQFAEEIEERNKKSMEELMSKIESYSAQLREITAILVEKKAWANQVRRTTVPQRLALNGWNQLMHRIGKGTGKRVPELQAEARKLMPMCQSAVPVWIMPLSRVVENFNPRTNQFDVVIIDEASQADVLALTALYMGKQVVIVGDKEQVSPTPVGQSTEEIDKLIDEHLQGIPNHKLYDGLFSIYDLAGTAFQPICLREHFRCVTPIIQFSNHLSYEGKIKPLRDESTVKVHPHTVAYRVEGATSRKKINEKEAQVVASLIIACTEQPEYQEASIGVISLVGEEQATVIDRLLQQNLPAEEYKKRRIQCGNSAQFQGDERDIIFLSLVDAASGDGPLTKRGEGANEMYKKRFNVAASRARDQIWVVYSMDPENDLKPGDIRGTLIKHAQDPNKILKVLDTQELKTKSELEKQVLIQLRQAGYTVHPKWKVGNYRIDMVIEGNGKRVALECDGDKWHTLDNLADDMSRQAILERLGWRFIRIRGSEFFRDPEKTISQIFERLTYYEVYPQNKERDDNRIDSPNSELKAQIIRRAAAIRKQWNGEGVLHLSASSKMMKPYVKT